MKRIKFQLPWVKRSTLNTEIIRARNVAVGTERMRQYLLAANVKERNQLDDLLQRFWSAEMDDKKRLLTLLHVLWQKNPRLRFGQLLVASFPHNPDLFYIDDETFTETLQDKYENGV